MKYIIDYDAEEEDLIDFLWDEDEDPPPVLRPKKKRPGGN